jgi:hypothetical protein
MPGKLANKEIREFHSAEQFETIMFPRVASERAIAREAQEPRSAGNRLAEEALARLKPSGLPRAQN